MITNYTCFDVNGKITKTGMCSKEDLHLQIDQDEQYILESADIFNQYVLDYKIVNMPKKPEGEYVFNYTTKQWEFDAVTADLKAKQQRDKLLAEGPDRISPMWWASMTEQEQQAWTFYRQALLDITEQADYPEFIVWPIKP